ncbi:FHA domain-containing protein [Massilia genomosp. 1]|uniref:FHA domain-containing protein n=1 Tax=Massilia genomosp. 1 TaxID=2609280 RepID=A0ABX0N2F8_9BURK|nr:FHA domain-containing protein [Massilia genomosp. 1]NHZ66558.1 FHA domain-containing protein [Massilia genomosp. 1]
MPGEIACANGHGQAASAVPAAAAETPAPVTAPANSSYELISALRSARPSAKPDAAPLAYPDQALPALQRPHLHISGFDPRAAGGRQAIKVELRGMPPDSAPLVTMQLQSALIAQGNARHAFVRTLRGDWRPLFIEFSSRDKEHGQYRIEVELFNLHDGRIRHKWVCTLVILVPRPDATLTEIHQTFLSTHKNVRVMADDASIARVNAQSGGGRLDIDVHARNASIAHVNLDAKQGKVDMGFSTIAWDEDLIEIDVPAHAEPHPHPTACACLVNAAPEPGAQRQVRLFAMPECVLGRFELYDPDADVLLTHFGDDGQDRDGLTRRLSGRHAVIRRGMNGFEIEDVSRYGILLDGVWPGKNKPVPLRLGMRIELSASIKGIVVLSVTAVMPHGVIVHRIDQGAHAECFYFLEPGKHPGFPVAPFGAAPRAAVMPVLYHQNGGFWHLDPATGKETALSPGAPLDRLTQFARHTRFASESYPECWIVRTALKSTHAAAEMHTA